jgi:hypothetical protein
MTRLTPERVAEIAARALNVLSVDGTVISKMLADDATALCADWQAMAAEIERLRAEVLSLKDGWDEAVHGIEAEEARALSAERRLAEAEKVVGELRAALGKSYVAERHWRRAAIDAERQMWAAEGLAQAIRVWMRTPNRGTPADSALVDAFDLFNGARQSPETAPASDLPEGAATHVAGEAR